MTKWRNSKVYVIHFERTTCFSVLQGTILTMTISYTSKVDTSRSCGFFRLFRLFKGSLIKAVGPDLAVYLIMYYTISFIYRSSSLSLLSSFNIAIIIIFIIVTTICFFYRFALTSHVSEDSKQRFEHLCIYCFSWKSRIPVQFILSFYVSQVGR